MSPGRIGAIALRIFRQFRRDRRTLGLVFVVPMFILGLLGYLTGLGTSEVRLAVAAVNEVPVEAGDDHALATDVLARVRSKAAAELGAVDKISVQLVPVADLGLGPREGLNELAPGVLAGTARRLEQALRDRVAAGSLDGAVLIAARSVVSIRLPAPKLSLPVTGAPQGPGVPGNPTQLDLPSPVVPQVELEPSIVVEGSIPSVTAASLGACRPALQALGPAVLDAYRQVWPEEAASMLAALDEIGLGAAGTGAGGGKSGTGDGDAAADGADEFDITYVHGGEDFGTLDYYGPVFIPFFAFFLTFLLSAVGLLRERAQGTMERILASPLSPSEVLLGYSIGYMLFALVQCAVVVTFVIYVLGVHYAGGLGAIFLITALLALVAVNIGCALSAFAGTELQAVQFIPVVIVPQALLGDIVWRVADMPAFLQYLAYLMPVTYANRALRAIMLRGESLVEAWPELAVLGGLAVGFYFLAWLTLRRQKRG